MTQLDVAPVHVMVVGNSDNTQGRENFLIKFIHILEPLVEGITVITGKTAAASFGDRTKLIELPIREPGGSLLSKAIAYLGTELRYFIEIRKHSGECQQIYIFGGERVLSTLAARISGKYTALHVGGLFHDRAKQLYGDSYLGLAGGLLSLLGKLEYHVCFLLADIVLVESESATSYLGLEHFKNKVSPCGAVYVDISCFHPKEGESHLLRVGYVGRFSEEKGFLEFVRCIPRLIGLLKTMQVIVVGEGHLKPELNILVESEEYVEVVKHVKFVESQEELAEVYRSLNLLVVPSHSEGVPNVLLEAMASGTPVLASPVGGIPDIIMDEKTGYILRSREPVPMVKQIVDILEDDSGRRRVSENALKLIETRFSLSSARERYAAIVQKGMDKR